MDFSRLHDQEAWKRFESELAGLDIGVLGVSFICSYLSPEQITLTITCINQSTMLENLTHILSTTTMSQFKISRTSSLSMWLPLHGLRG